MIGVRDAVEQAIFASLGAAALTKEKAERVVADLVGRGHLGAEEGATIVTRLMSRVRSEGPPAQSGVMSRLEDGAQALFQDLGLARASDLDEIRTRLAELEHRLRLVERPATPE